MRGSAQLILACVAVSAEPIKVFVVSGQSNMEGYGLAKETTCEDGDHRGGSYTLDALVTADALKPLDTQKYQHLRDSSGEWVVRDDVEIELQGDQVAGDQTPPGKGLTVGFGSTKRLGASDCPGAVFFGPELQIGHVLGEAHGARQKVLLPPCEVFRRGNDTNRNAGSVLGRACARSSTLYTQRHTPRLHRLLDTQA